MAVICGNCGRNVEGDFAFCPYCGSKLEAPSAPREFRKTVTVVFADVTGSTKLGERLDPESMRALMSRYFELIRQVLEKHGGTVEKFIGDAVMAVFGIPQLHEDDALRAVRAAHEIRNELINLNHDLESQGALSVQFRTGVNTGEVVAGDPAGGQTLVTGDAVNVAARLEQSAHPGEILIGETTHKLVRDAVSVEELDPLSLKGKTEGVKAFRLLSVDPQAEGFSRRLDSPLVGREREAALLRQAFDRAVTDCACHLFTLMGSAGVGKSRLVAEFLDSIRDQATILGGRCLPYGEGISFWPVREIVKMAVNAGDTESTEETRDRLLALLSQESDGETVADIVAGLIGDVESGRSLEEGFWAVRRLLQTLADERPLVVVFDDIHWADASFLDLIEHIADLSRDSSILLLCLARPDLLEKRPGWGGGKLNASSILLEPLSDDECNHLIENLLGHARLSSEAEERIRESAEGNPLFVEEMLRMLIDDGLLYRQNGHWAPAGSLDSITVPATVSALLGARIDRLSNDERQVIERAALGGKVFYRGAVAELSPEPIRPEIGRHLATLARRELIRNDRATFAGEEAFRFRHILIRDAAYEAMPKETRAELHERFASWLEHAAGESAPEYEEIVGYHLEQAYRYRRELGRNDEATTSLGELAAARLSAAARRADQRSDIAAALNLYSRVNGLLPIDARQRPELMVQLGDALHTVGRFDEAVEVLKSARQLAESNGDERASVHAQLAQLSAVNLLSSFDADAALEVVENRIPGLIAAGDNLGLARAYWLLGMVRNLQAHMAERDEALMTSARYSAEADDPRLRAQTTMAVLGAIVRTPAPLSSVADRVRDIQESFQDSPLVQAFVNSALGEVASMRGQIVEARAYFRECVRLLRELGQNLLVWAVEGQYKPAAEMLAGEWSAAEDDLRRADEALRGMGEKGWRSTTLGYLTHVLYELGKDDEALAVASESSEIALPDDALTHVLWRSGKAKVMARRGAMAEAEALAREAVDLSRTTDVIDLQAQCLEDLGRVLAAAGRKNEATVAFKEAIELFEAKEATRLAARTRQRLAELADP